MKQIVANIIQTPDGTILQSYHRHDYKLHKDANGLTYMVDGGLEYLRRTEHPNNPYIEKTLYSDDDFEQIRKYHSRGSRGKNNDEPLRWIPLCDMENDHLLNCIEYNIENGYAEAITTRLYLKELKYRNKK